MLLNELLDAMVQVLSSCWQGTDTEWYSGGIDKVTLWWRGGSGCYLPTNVSK